jgi:hypothetical protein
MRSLVEPFGGDISLANLSNKNAAQNSIESRTVETIDKR